MVMRPALSVRVAIIGGRSNFKSYIFAPYIWLYSAYAGKKIPQGERIRHTYTAMRLRHLYLPYIHFSYILLPYIVLL